MTLSVQEAIAERHSVRRFQNAPLKEEEITALLEAARLAPSSLNSQPWRFKVVTGEEDRKWFATTEATRNQAWLAAAPAIIVCCADLKGYVRDSQASVFFYKENELIAGETLKGIEEYVARAENSPELAKFAAGAMNVSIAVSFMMLRAVELGLGTCWLGMLNEGNIKARLGLGDDLRIVCLLAVGRPDEDTVYPSKRKSLEEIIIP